MPSDTESSSHGSISNDEQRRPVPDAGQDKTAQSLPPAAGNDAAASCDDAAASCDFSMQVSPLHDLPTDASMLL